jgi:predicted phosphohydrolase
MKLQYCSDLHLEFPENRKFIKDNPLQVKGDVLVLAGDIMLFAHMDKHEVFFDGLSDKFETVYWIPGNHEYYHFDASQKSGVLNERIRSNVFLVNNVAIEKENVRIIFSTMWSKISPAYEWQIERGMSDFRVIKYNGSRFSALQYNQLHQNSLDFIGGELNKPFEGKTVVATHHVPTFLNYPEMYKGSVLTEGFAVELFDFIQDSNIDYWIYGHHHSNVPEFVIGKTQMLTNQLGYVIQNENREFKNDKFIIL